MLSIEQLEKRGIDAIGYTRAQQHYEILKKKMIKQLEQNQKLKSSLQKNLIDFNSNIEKNLIQSIETNDKMTEKSSQLLEQLESAIIKQLQTYNASQELRDLLQKITDSGRKGKNIKKSADERLLDRLKKHQEKII